MWVVNGQDIKMCEGDYGVALPITITGTTLEAFDEVKFTVKKVVNGSVMLEKTFSNISQNTINLELTETESNHFKVGTYYYALDWYQNGEFMCNIIPIGAFKVVEKV